jgi:hypothetical protein
MEVGMRKFRPGSPLWMAVMGGSGWPNPPVPDPTKTTYFWDTFTDTDGVWLENHVPDIDVGAGGWIKDSAGRITINSGTIVPDGSDTYFCDPGMPSVNLQADIVFSSGNLLLHDFVQLNFRAANAAAKYMLTVGKLAGAGAYSFWKDATKVAEGVFTYAEGAHHIIRVEDNGSVMTATIDGGNPLSYTSADYNTNTKVGVIQFIDALPAVKQSIDNFWVWQ